MDNKNIQVELLYFGHGIRSTEVPRHSHPYFQLEYCIAGHLPAGDGSRKMILNAGDCWMIPPGGMHKFTGTSGKLDYISIKFTTSASLADRVINDRICQYYLEHIRAVIDGETAFNPYGADGKTVIENHLYGILQHLLRETEQSPRSEFLTELQRLIGERGAAANVDALAESFQLSRSEFKYRFLQETGSGRIKQYIDGILLNIAEQHMCYSDIPLGRIAEQMKFSSIYAFSRYYKQRRGITPSEFRQKNRTSSL